METDPGSGRDVKIILSIAASFVVTLMVAVGLAFSQEPQVPEGGGGLDFSEQLGGSDTAPAPLQSVPARDGYAMQYRRYEGAEGAPLLVLVHGSGWHGLQFDSLAKALQGKADVIVPDLRGHGTAPGRRGDIDYIGQFEDDLADLIDSQRRPGQAVILGGHSSGGGLVIRFAGGAYGETLDGAVLLAPYLQHDAPTTRSASGGWAHVALRRIIGLSILNTFRISVFNHLPVIAFNMPQDVLDGPLGDTATTRYSYRLNTGFAPRRDYLADVAALPPFLLLAGSRDEAFVAELYGPTMADATEKGRYLVLNGATHLDIVNDGRTRAEIEAFLDGY
ncbi:alpha/beta fold hydrolase [Sulfitobacter albidus]|uniref:Alpha/beta fold hydrolase n=1 Tax=Sulfitobacter albidus TaxID=2829501 RepID=A0A975JFZ9_9RHOB|nr:alpha/beta fold hydrolase [Sulfitobacter albidus]QUJ77819.1 alpha/beta fold hydrolase [Sulfitobacter albidus]